MGYKKKTHKKKLKDRKKIFTRKRRKRKKRKIPTKQKKKKFNIKKLKKEKCAPKKKGDYLEFSCYTPEVLYKMRDIWNVRHPDVKIETNNLKKIWETMGYQMQNTCDREACWIKDNMFKGEIEKEKSKNLFAPKQPEEWKKNPTAWLSSIEILQLMKQYENAYHCFEFLGPSPIDYDEHVSHGECVWEDLCKFDLKETIKRGKNKIGIIFNLDEHDKDGSHWVAMFVNIKLKEIYYFDSYGDPAPTRIRKLGWEIQKQSGKIGKRFKFKTNKLRHQYTRSECGMYSLYFIIQLLKDVKFETFHKRILDKKMIDLRKKLFNK
jgi:hypothetical protein